MNYTFNAEIAQEYGVKEAIFIQYLFWWQQKNKADNRNFHTVEIIRPNGEKMQVSGYWTFNSMQVFTKIFPFWTHRQIRTIIENCRMKEAIYTARMNQKKYDNTLWYLLKEPVVKKLNAEVKEQSLGYTESEESNIFAEKVQPIPVSIQQLKKNYIHNSSCHTFSKNEDIKTAESLMASSKPRKSAKRFEVDSEPYKLALYLENCIRFNEPKFPQSEQRRQRWAKDIDRMLRIDKIDPDEAAAVIAWSQKDSFWRTNILSGKKLREKYPQLLMKMNQKKR